MLGPAACVALFIVFVYTPTITIHVRNDTSEQLRVFSCGSDPITLDPGQTGDIDPNPHDPHAACIVDVGGVEIGCLYIPTTRYTDGSTVRLSATIQGVPIGKCGD